MRRTVSIGRSGLEPCRSRWWKLRLWVKHFESKFVRPLGSVLFQNGQVGVLKGDVGQAQIIEVVVVRSKRIVQFHTDVFHSHETEGHEEQNETMNPHAGDVVQESEWEGEDVEE